MNKLFLLSFILKQIILAISSEFNGTGAIDDLKVDSKEITEYLNVPIFYQNIVPTHTISTSKN
jgi:hypothetical protein